MTGRSRAALIGALAAWSLTLTAETCCYESITFGATAVGFTAATITPTDGRGQVLTCEGIIETAAIRERHDGGVPTASEGKPLAVGDWFRLDGHDDLRKFKGIRSTGTSGVIKFHCSRAP